MVRQPLPRQLNRAAALGIRRRRKRRASHAQQLHAVAVRDGDPVRVCFGPLELVHWRRRVVDQDGLVDALGQRHEVPDEGHAVVGRGAYVALAVGGPCDAVDAGVVGAQQRNWNSGNAYVENNHLKSENERGAARGPF